MGNKNKPRDLEREGKKLLNATQQQFDDATRALHERKWADFEPICTQLGIPTDAAKGLYRALKDYVDDIDWGWQ